MSLRSDNRDFQLTDISGISRHIYHAEKSSPVNISITGFNFTCDTATGAVRRETTQVVGHIHHRMSEDQMGIYDYNIKLSLMIAARRDLIDRIQALGDEKLNDVIPDQVSGPNSLVSMSELLVNSVLSAIARESKPPTLLGKFGFSTQTRTQQQKAVHLSLRSGVASVNTYGDVERVWSLISDNLQQSVSKQVPPSPR